MEKQEGDNDILWCDLRKKQDIDASLFCAKLTEKGLDF